jgi:hypothetical protein
MITSAWPSGRADGIAPFDSLFSRKCRLRPLVVVLLFSAAAGGCVPIPYRPEAHVTHTPVTASAASSITVSSPSKRGMANPLSQSIRKSEPRIVVVNSGGEVEKAVPASWSLLSQTMSSGPNVPPADYLLAIGPPVYRKLHDTGDAEPFLFFPAFWVGYEKVQSMETMCASLIDLRAPASAEGILVTTAYTEVVAALAYGVSTVAMPQTSIRNALAEDVARRLAAAHPTGPIRLMILAQEGGDRPGSHVCTPEPRKSEKALAAMGAPPVTVPTP